MNEKRCNVDEIVDAIFNDYEQGREIDRMDFFGQPDQDIVNDILQKLLQILYPGYYRDANYTPTKAKHMLAAMIEDVICDLSRQIEIVLVNDPRYMDASKDDRRKAAEDICTEFFKQIPKVREYLDTDIDATFDGDPAAFDKVEIVLAYPGLYATTVHRLAHELEKLKVPYIPRLMSEHAHSVTGVDIHPGANIDKYFFIDHATGIVIGETSDIGKHVKVYQGVTIGALSTKDGQSLKGSKRHPTIEDNVTLYAGAAILGGDTVIGHDSVIGGSAFVTKSVPPYSQVLVNIESTVVAP